MADRPGGKAEPDEPDQIRADIEDTREDLGEIVEALAKKADVKSHAKAKVDERKEALNRKQQELKGKVSDIPRRARQVKPEDAKRAASRVANQARARPGPAVAVALVLALVLVRLVRRD
jgi:chromosome segregation ATPase